MSKEKDLRIVLAAACLLWLKTAAVSYFGFDLAIDTWTDALFILFNPAGSVLLLAGCSFYFTKSVNKTALIVTMLLVSGLLFADLLYYRFYIDYVTVSILFQFKNVGGIGPSTFELIKGWDILLFIDIIIFWIFIRRWKGKSLPSSVKRNYLFASAGLIILIGAAGLIKSPHLLEASYNRGELVKIFGPYNYHAADILMGMRPELDRAVADETDTAEIEEFIKGKSDVPSGFFGAAKGKNIVLVSMESTQNFVINESVDGREITPFLNDLLKESFYFSQIYDQTAQGKTSDAEFMVDTSFYPLPGGSVFVRRPDNVFHSLPAIMKDAGYYSAVFHGNDPSFWNRENMYKNLGYDKFYSKEDYEVTEDNSVNYGIKDIPFLKQTASYLKKLPEPYMAKVITLTNHFPFLLKEEDIMIPEAETDEDVVNRYVTTVRYQDEALRHFFEDLKEKGQYENTVFVMYGDHYGISRKYEDALASFLGDEPNPLNHFEYMQVPLIIHIPGMEGKQFDMPGGEVDIRQTLLDLMGISTEDRISFGRVLFNRDEGQPVVFRDGSFVNDSYIYQGNICYSRKTKERVAPSFCEPYASISREELGLSDRIIYGDLLRFMEQD